MKILGISFGTQNGNNDAMCKEALKGAKEIGAEVEFINMMGLQIKPCTGCIACVKSLMSGKGNRCALKDDFDWLLDKMLDADGIIIADPIFEKGGTGLFHTITDRFGPRMDRGNNMIAIENAQKTGGIEPDPRILKDKFISYIAIGGSDWGTRVQCDHAMLALTPMWTVIDNEWFPWAKGIIMDDEKVERANEIGKTLARAALDKEGAKYKGEKGVCPHCHSRNFFLDMQSTHAVCCLCGIEGDIEIVDGKIKFRFPEEQIEHAHDTLSGKMIHGNDIKVNEGKLMDIKRSEEYKLRVKAYKEFIQTSVPERR